MKKIIFADRFKTISDLCELNGRVYLELPNDAKGNEFMKRAEEEGFTFEDGVKPTERDYSRVMQINKDKTLNYLGAMGMMAYGSGCKSVDTDNGRKKVIRVLYETETGYEQKGSTQMKEIIFSKKFKTISELCNLKGKVYVKFASSESGDDFMKCAEREGFAFKDGVKPTARVCAKIMRVNPDKTLNYVGIYGNMAYDAAKKVGGQKLIRVIY